MFYLVCIFLVIFHQVYKRLKNLFTMPLPSGVSFFIGPAGSGKTTLASFFVQRSYKQNKKNNRVCVSNVPILNSCELDCNYDFEHYSFTNVHTVIVDEAGIQYNNRSFKTLPKPTIEFVKYYRHHGIERFIMLSQGLDIDVTFYRMCEHIYLVHQSILPGFISVREVRKDTDIDQLSEELKDKHFYVKGGRHLVYAKPYWDYFDSWELPLKPEKQWTLYGSSSRYEQLNFNKTFSVRRLCGSLDPLTGELVSVLVPLLADSDYPVNIKKIYE